uniref:PDDEXK_1 domain-containing protein n=1 Tax=Heterorhabditis bacteriophora TaxID=37862 RepID=A0A1I7XP00_HETBA
MVNVVMGGAAAAMGSGTRSTICSMGCSRSSCTYFTSHQKSTGIVGRGPSDVICSSNYILKPSTRCSIRTNISGRLPSVSLIQSCTEEKSALLRWQEKMIKEIGLTNFRRWNKERLYAGTCMHNSVAKLLKIYADDGKLPSEGTILFDPDSSTLCVEQCVIHHDLMYKGRFDAVLRYKDAVFMIDWKTSTANSAVAKNISLSNKLESLYGYPQQVAAYTAAFNSDPTYVDREQISCGAVVLAYESGEEAKVIEINSKELEA